MKTILLFTLMSLYSLLLFSQDESKIKELEDIQNFCKTNFDNSIWFDYDECNLNNVQFFKYKESYEFKLSSIKEVSIDSNERRVRKNKSNAYSLEIRTYPSAKIKKTYGVNDFYFIFIIVNNGLQYLNQMTITGNKEEIEVLKAKMENILKTQ